MKLTFALMSGGEGRRFGSDKTKALLNGKPLYLYGLELGLSLTDDILHLSRDPAKYEPFTGGVRYIADAYPNQCPMAGMITAANEARYDHLFVLSADSPLLQKPIVEFLFESGKGYDAVIPVINGKYYNLAALYSKKMLKSLYDYYNQGVYKITLCYENFNILFIDENILNVNGFSQNSFININTAEELETASNLLLERVSFD